MEKGRFTLLCLAWHMRVDPVEGTRGQYIIIDAHTGEFLFTEPMCIR